MELLWPMGLLALAGAPAVVALYFWRRRRTPEVVGSLLLWTEAQRLVWVRRPWERLRHSTLMWLQLLVILLVAVALARPARVTSSLVSHRVILVFDASASMAARDGHPTRWVDAIDQGRKVAGSAPPGCEVALLAAGRVTQIIAPFTTDRALIEQNLDALEARGPDETGTSMRDALLLAVQLGQSDDAEIFVLSDGAFDPSELPPLSRKIHFASVGASNANLAITHFELSRRVDQRPGTTVSCRVVNTGATAMSAHLEFNLDGVAVEAHSLELGPGDERTFSVPISADRGVVRAHLWDSSTPSGAEDVLATDDNAWAVIAGDAPVEVLAVGADPLVERALRVNRHLRVSSITPEDYVGPGTSDVTVFEGVFPTKVPGGRFLAIAPAHENPLIDLSGEIINGTHVASWDHGHPVLDGVDLAGVRFGKVRRARPRDALVPIAEFTGDDGPFVLVGHTPTWRGVVVTVDPLESDLPLRVAFPSLLYNAIGWLSPGGDSLNAQGRTGHPLAIPAQAGARVEIVRPDGKREVREVRGDDGIFNYEQTAEAGLYQVTTQEPGRRPRTTVHGVSLVDRAESQVAPRDRLALPRGAELVAAEPVAIVQEGRGMLALGALALMLLEWVLYAWTERRSTEKNP